MNSNNMSEQEKTAIELEKIEFERREFQRVKNEIEIQDMEDILYTADDEIDDEEEFQAYEDEYTRAYAMMQEFAS